MSNRDSVHTEQPRFAFSTVIADSGAPLAYTAKKVTIATIYAANLDAAVATDFGYAVVPAGVEEPANNHWLVYSAPLDGTAVANGVSDVQVKVPLGAGDQLFLRSSTGTVALNVHVVPGAYPS